MNINLDFYNFNFYCYRCKVFMTFSKCLTNMTFRKSGINICAATNCSYCKKIVFTKFYSTKLKIGKLMLKEWRKNENKKK